MTNGPVPHDPTEDLTLREAQEAKKLGLDLRAYLNLKERFYARACDEQYASWDRSWKASVEVDLRERLKKAVTDEERNRLEAEVGAKMFEKARQELLSDKSTPKERQAVREFAREVEIEALTNARTASTTASQLENRHSAVMLIRRPVFYALLFALLPVAYWLYSHGYDALRGCSILIPWVVALFTVGIQNGARNDKAKAGVKEAREIASTYWRIAEMAKQVHMVDGQVEGSRREIRNALDELVKAKREVDEKFTPSAEALDASRKKIREMLITEGDTEQFLRVSDIKSEVLDPEPAAPARANGSP